MKATIEPTAEVVFDAAVWENGVSVGAPKNDEEWNEVRNNALTLAESGNLLIMAPRARRGGLDDAIAGARRCGRRRGQSGGVEEPGCRLRCGRADLPGLHRLPPAVHDQRAAGPVAKLGSQNLEVGRANEFQIQQVPDKTQVNRDSDSVKPIRKEVGDVAAKAQPTDSYRKQSIV